MKKLFLLLFFATLCSAASAQDLIVRNDKDATDITAKVLRVSDSKVEYLDWNNLEGPVYELPVHDVLFIRYQNGTKDIFAQQSETPQYRQGSRFEGYPKYQGEVTFGYGLGVGNVAKVLNLDRIVLETVHGVRINPYLFAGAGLGVNFFYADLFEDSGIGGMPDSGIVLPVFVNGKAYCPVGRKTSLHLSVDLGAAIPVSGYFEGGTTEFYAAVGPGVSIGSSNNFRLDLGIRFQYMGTGFNAILFRVGFGF